MDKKLRNACRFFFFPFRFVRFSIRKTHPGAVVHLSDNPLDANKVNAKTKLSALQNMVASGGANLAHVSDRPASPCLGFFFYFNVPFFLFSLPRSNSC